MNHSIGRKLAALPLAALVLIGGCDAGLLEPNPLLRQAPRDLDARYQWIFEGFRDLRSVGGPAVEVTWLLPEVWNGEVFRVYARELGRSRYVRAATVTSCGNGLCSYTDRNVLSGAVYEYYVAAYDERSGEEIASDFKVEVRVPRTTLPAPPDAPTVAPMDGALLLRWQNAGAAALSHTRVFLVAVDGEAALYETGRTDGTAFLDTRTRSGHSYTYRLASVDTLGHVSNLSAAVTGVPRAAASSLASLAGSPFRITPAGAVHFGSVPVPSAGAWFGGAAVHPAPAAYRLRPDEAELTRLLHGSAR